MPRNQYLLSWSTPNFRCQVLDNFYSEHLYYKAMILWKSYQICCLGNFRNLRVHTDGVGEVYVPCLNALSVYWATAMEIFNNPISNKKHYIKMSFFYFVHIILTEIQHLTI